LGLLLVCTIEASALTALLDAEAGRAKNAHGPFVGDWSFDGGRIIAVDRGALAVAGWRQAAVA
jgi:hypothetical protein